MPIELTKDEVKSLMTVYVNETEEKDWGLYISVCRKIGAIFGMFYDPDKEKIKLIMEE